MPVTRTSAPRTVDLHLVGARRDDRAVDDGNGVVRAGADRTGFDAPAGDSIAARLPVGERADAEVGADGEPTDLAGRRAGRDPLDAKTGPAIGRKLAPAIAGLFDGDDPCRRVAGNISENSIVERA